MKKALKKSERGSQEEGKGKGARRANPNVNVKEIF